jgi:large repetitive protein
VKTQSILLLITLIFVSVLCGAASAAEVPKNALLASDTADTSVYSNSSVNSQVMNTEIPFIENHGQRDPSIKYYANTFYGTAYVTQDSITHSIQNKDNQTLTVNEQFLDANGNVIILNPKAEERSQTPVSYFLGNNPEEWQTGLDTWNLVNLGEIYPGITVKLKANGENIEKLFFVSPGANPDDIRILVRGVDALSIDSEGKLILEPINFSNISMTKPTAYQGNKDINTNYTINGDTYGYSVANYDYSKPLLIDPLLSYSTYLGVTGDDGGYGVAFDNNENVYITGITLSSSGNFDALVAKINPQGTLVYFIQLGGSGYEKGRGIVVDSSGNVYITGETKSINFPTTTNSIQPNYGGGDSEAFMTKINPEGSDLVYSTYLGGASNDYGYGIAIDNNRNVYIIGEPIP